MPRYLLGVLLLLLVSVSEMQAQGDVVLYIEGKPVYRSEFEYYYRKAPKQTPEAYLPAFINYKLKVRYAMDSGLDTVSAFRRQLSFYEGRLVKSYVVDAGMEEQEARFIQQFEAGLYKGLLWEITAELEIRDRPTLSEGALDILLDSDPVKLGRTVERLHFLVHTFIPNKLNK